MAVHPADSRKAPARLWADFEASYGRMILVLIALLLIVSAVLLRLLSAQTSLVTVVTYPLPAASASGTAATPVTPLPGAGATPVAPAPVVTETDTRTAATASDGLVLGLVGLAALFVFIGAFYNRLTAVTGPGGIGISLSPAQRRDVSDAVARKAVSRVVSDTSPGSPGSGSADAGARLVEMARGGETYPPGEVLAVTSEAARNVSAAALQTAQTARSLLDLAQKHRGEFAAYVRDHGIPADEWGPVYAGEITGALWDRLAEQALDEVIRSRPAS